jgi:S1-C subfamily serine protease
MLKQILTAIILSGVASCSPAYAESIYATQLDQTVRIETDGVGAGVVIAKDTILTAAHVVGDEKEVTVQFRGEFIGMKGKVIKAVPELDLALVHIKLPEGTTITPVSCKHYDAGEPTLIIGMPYGLPWVITTGIIATDDVYGDRLLVSNKTDHGNSGGPVFNSKKELIGILLNGIGHGEEGGNQGNSFGGMIPTELFCKEFKLHEGVN